MKWNKKSINKGEKEKEEKYMYPVQFDIDVQNYVKGK